MDRISMLQDDVILSFVPSKDAITTNLLSKRWRYLWKHMSKLEYRDLSFDTEHWRASRFVDKFLLLHKASVLETLHLTLGRNCLPTVIETWIRVAISRGVRNLHIFQYRTSSGLIRLPRGLYTCETLVTLNLSLDITVDDVPFIICFRSLKVLVLLHVKFPSDEIVDRILSGCPVLEDLTVVRGNNDNVKTFTIAVPSLQRLLVIDCGSQVPGDVDVGFVIKAPSLKSLFIVSRRSRCCSLVKMPDLVKADIKLRHGDPKKFMGCLTSTKQLSLCLKPPMDSCRIGVFNQLVSLNLCACSLIWCRHILNHTPKLRVLKFELKEARKYPTLNYIQRRCSSSVDVQTQWEQPSCVPECLLVSLDTVKWTWYKGTEEEKSVVMYLLENGNFLETMSNRFSVSITLEEKNRMQMELESMPRSSSRCQLSFT